MQLQKSLIVYLIPMWDIIYGKLMSQVTFIHLFFNPPYFRGTFAFSEYGTKVGTTALMHLFVYTNQLSREHPWNAYSGYNMDKEILSGGQIYTKEAKHSIYFSIVPI